jgi:hypothetical protein
MSPNAEPALESFSGDRLSESVAGEALNLPEFSDSAARDLRTSFDLTEIRFLGERLDLARVGTGRAALLYAGRLKRLRVASTRLFALARTADDTPGLSEIRSNLGWLTTDLTGLFAGFAKAPALPQAKAGAGKTDLRIALLAEAFLRATDNRFADDAFAAFVTGMQKSTALSFKELWSLPLLIKLNLFERLIEEGEQSARPEASAQVNIVVQALRDLLQAPWVQIIEPLIVFDHVLRTDPVYGQMDFASRQVYRERVIQIAEHSSCSESEVAAAAVTLARTAKGESDERRQRRLSHVGYYLVGDGLSQLTKRVGYRAPLQERLISWVQRHPDWVYAPAIALLTAVLALGFVLIFFSHAGLNPYTLLAACFFALPASEVAAWIVNFLVGAALKPRQLPKLDYDSGLPSKCRTLVAVPTLLLSEKQVRTLVRNLEVRFVGNQDPNLFFALLTDLPDRKEQSPEHHPLVELAAELIKELNEKYRAVLPNRFLLLHRQQFYNPHEGAWMGWERKRGKLLDLNNFLQGRSDPFPSKAGDVSVLTDIRYVITLDADTELPRGAGRRLVATLAHPLNQAIIDPVKNLVVEGYGLLQPRVRISVESSTRSRLARMYSGQTGLDIYSCAISDVYQDLFGEGSFAGKGIYEVAVLQKVLDGRFPCNALLSHDLIEGAYARAGLVSDIEVVEDYPSRYTAYNKRKHRWIRGDWQVAGWLGRYARDEQGQRVPNPISFCSRWKIADNLRRSLVEPATMLFFLFAWLGQPGIAWTWTLAGLGLLFAPAIVRFGLELFSMVLSRRFDQFGYTIDAFAENVVASGLTLVFLAHQTLLSVDAIMRTIWRKIHHRRLLEWETAAQAEICGTKRTAIDRYLDWTPAFALTIAGLLLFSRPASLLPAAPFLLLWAASRSISEWLNRPAHRVKKSLTDSDRTFVRLAAMRTWRYFAELSRAENNWLIPDNLQGDPRRVAERLSPTNLGLLLNARQVARELGFITLPELVDLTLRTLHTVDGLPKYRGHLFNWYDTQTLSPIHPCFVSTVDNGNLLASLITLRQGCQTAVDNPLLSASLFEGVADLILLLCEESIGAVSGADADRWRTVLRGGDWYACVDAVKELAGDWKDRQSGDAASWWDIELEKRLGAILETIASFAPWLLPDFRGLATEHNFTQPDRVRDLPDYLEKVITQLKTDGGASRGREEVDRLLDLCLHARERAVGLLNELNELDNLSDKLAEQMDFAFLVNERRKLLCIGFDFDHQVLPSACYDLLASEARTAAFLAVARGELPVKSWFRLGRTPANGSDPVISSWTGTMFEYFMPALWMRSYPETLLEQAMFGALRRQQSHAASAGVPWGISECAHAIRDAAGNYGYQAFGEPSVAVSTDSTGDLVISPYSTFLTLSCDPGASTKNLRQMAESGWIGGYGFYEAADLRGKDDGSPDDCELIHCWMAHHQGMSLLAAANLLLDGIVQNWFHRDERVCATEILLQEKPLPSSVFERVVGAAFNRSQPMPKGPSRSRLNRKRSADFGWRRRSALNGSLSPGATETV